LNTIDLIKLFATLGFAININSLTIFPNVFGTAVTYVIEADSSREPAETADEQQYTKLADFNIVITDMLSSLIAGATVGRILNTAPPGYKTLVDFTTANVAPITKSFSMFPVTNTMIIGWDADVDFVIEFDFTVLPVFMNMRTEVMDLLENRRQLEDPSISNTQGKRVLARAGLLVLEE